MADVTISSLPTGAPSGNALLPFSNGASTLSVPVSSLLTNTNTLLNTRRIFHSSVNTSAAATNFIDTPAGSGGTNFNNPSPVFTDLVQTGNTWTYGYTFQANTGGYPSCPYQYYTVCPVQKKFNFAYAKPTFATVEFYGAHRGIWATTYGVYHKFNVAVDNDSGGITLVASQRGAPGTADGPESLRHLAMDKNGIVAESASFGTNIGVNIGNTYYGWCHPYGETPSLTPSLQIPFLFKIYTKCGADFRWFINVTTTNPDMLGPPFKGAVMLAANTAPTQSMYLNL